MRITGVEAHVCNARMRNWVFVRVLTDEDGLYGWGEATLEWHTRSVVGAVEDLAELLVGEDPTRIAGILRSFARNCIATAAGEPRQLGLCYHGRQVV